jgi:hypothetical protein
MISASASMPRRAFFRTDPIPNWERAFPNHYWSEMNHAPSHLTQNEGKYIARGRFYEMPAAWPLGIPKMRRVALKG